MCPVFMTYSFFFFFLIKTWTKGEGGGKEEEMYYYRSHESNEVGFSQNTAIPNKKITECYKLLTLS